MNRLAPSRRAGLPDPTDRPVVSAVEAFAVLGIDRRTGYRAIRDGTFPVAVVRIGRVIRIPTRALRRLVEADQSPAEPIGRLDGVEGES